jgi:hypothetical protein
MHGDEQHPDGQFKENHKVNLECYSYTILLEEKKHAVSLHTDIGNRMQTASTPSPVIL